MSVNADFGNAPNRPTYLSRALIVTRRELRDNLRDWRILTPILSLVVILPTLLSIVLAANKNYLVEHLTEDAFFNKVLPFATLAIGFLPMSFCLVIALESFVGEKERNSLEALMTAPITDMELFLGKFLAAIVPTVGATVISSLVFFLVMALFGITIPVSFWLILTFLGLNAAEALVMVAAALMISTHTTTVRSANIMASFVILPMSLVVQIEGLLLISGFPDELYFIFPALIILLIVLIRAGVRMFNREDIVSREGDSISVRGIFGGFGYFFRRTPREGLAGQKDGQKFTIWRLYRRDIPQIMALNKAGFIMIGITTVAAMIIFYWVSTWPEVQALTGDAISSTTHANPLCLDTSSLQRSSFMGINTTWSGIFKNNLSSVLIGSALSLVSLGGAALLIPMISLGPISLVWGILTQHNINPLVIILAFILPHGIFELPAIIIGLAVGFRLGTALIAPPPGMGIGRSFQFAVVNYIKTMALVAPLLLIAALIESNLTATIGCWLTNNSF